MVVEGEVGRLLCLAPLFGHELISRVSKETSFPGVTGVVSVFLLQESVRSLGLNRGEECGKQLEAMEIFQPQKHNKNCGHHSQEWCTMQGV